MAKIIKINEEKLTQIVENVVKTILKESNVKNYGLLSNNNTGNQGLKNIKIYNQIKNDLSNNIEVMYSLPIDFEKTFDVRITPLQEYNTVTFDVVTSGGSKKVPSVREALSFAEQTYYTMINQN